MKKSKICIILAAVLAFSCLTACGGNKDEGNKDRYPKKEWSDGFEHYSVPDEYSLECENGGKIETLAYSAEAYAIESKEGLAEKSLYEDKKAYVYLPYGYTSEKKYNVLYLLHGSNETVDYWFYTQKFTSAYYRYIHGIENTRYSMNFTKNLLDNLISKGEIEPLIVVTPTYFSPTKKETYYGSGDATYVWIDNFEKELRNDVIPLVESKYSVYAESTDEAGLKASREHRAIAGFSRGSRFTTKFGITNMIDVFSYVGSFHAAEALTTEKLRNVIDANPDCPIKYWYNGFGANDNAAKTQIELTGKVKTELTSYFKEGVNFAAVDKPYSEHTYDSAITDLYNALKVFFKEAK